MRELIKAIAAVAIAAMTVTAPLAAAQDPAPRGLSSRGSSENFIGQDPSRWDSSPVSYPRIKAAMRNDSSRASPYRRGSGFIQRGLKAERNGDNEKACKYYTRARQAFADINSSAGMNESELHMDRTCEPVSG